MTTKKTSAKKPAAKRTPLPVGRPTAYKPEYDEKAYKLCLLGLTDVQMADIFGVSEQTINAWKHANPSFLEAATRGKTEADAEIAKALYPRAKGYSHPAVKIMSVANQVEQVPYTEHYPPDTQAASLWLRNRQPALWRDKQEIKADVTVTPMDEFREFLMQRGSRLPIATEHGEGDDR